MTTAHAYSRRRWFGLGLLTAAIGIGFCATAAWDRPDVLWRAYLVGLVPCWLVTVGATGLLALGNLTGGRWAEAARPFYLAAMRNLPLVAFLFVPLAFGLTSIYPWALAGATGEMLSPSKAAYLSPPFFLSRAVAYFVVWLFVSWWLGSVSRLDLPPASTFAMRRAGALGLVLLIPTSTFAAFDWVMSLEPHWYSSIYGAILTAGGVLAAHSLALIGLGMMRENATGENELSMADIYSDLGNLTLAFVMLWTYFSFSQFLIIWSANLPSEIAWYDRRLSAGWRFVALGLVVCCFAFPFLLLLARDLKRDIRKLSAVAVLLLAAYGLNMYWTIVPAFPESKLAGHLANAGAIVGLGGLWFAFYCWHIGRTTAVPSDVSR